ncbi:MAG: transpeptidase family protein [Prevotellaceae bacterium]|jgi:cell division protein FtsI (penicillin-binding protein 3)|nr:transpeptidase family protein [Prevotellaceae bacterium]
MTTVKNIVRRITLFYLLTVFLSVAIVAQIIYLQFFTEFKAKAEQFALKTESLEASRGNIYSYDMRLLAASIQKYEIFIDFYTLKDKLVENKSKKLELYHKKINLTPVKIKKRTSEQIKEDTKQADIFMNEEIKETAKSLSELFKDKSADEYEIFLKTKIKTSSEKSCRHEKIGNRKIDFIELKKIKSFPIFKFGQFRSGLKTIEKTDRIYTYDKLAATTIGNVNSKSYSEVGVERTFNEYLKGKEGLQVVMRIAPEEWMPISSEDNVLPESGCDVVTTLDVTIQETAEKALRQQIQKGNDEGKQIEGGTAIVMEVATGEIRAIANIKRNEGGGYVESYNYALTETSPPGSTFKLATLIALLDDKLVDLNDIVETQSIWEYRKDKKLLHTFKEASGHNYGTITVKQVFAKSSNVGFAKLAVKYYENNPQKFFNKLQSMGLFQESLNLQITGESKPHVTTPDNKKWQLQLLPLSAIGYELTLAPIHTLTLYNAVANNGKMMKPKFVKEIIKHGQVVESYRDEVIKSEICSKETLAKVRQALQGVVDSGTAVKIRDSRFDFAGKTGTAQRVVNGKFHDSQGRTAYQATFAGYIPANEPKYTIVVVMYSPQISGNFYGGTYAAPVFKEIAEKLYSTDINWYKPVERNNDSLCLPDAKSTIARQINNIASKLNIPFDNDAKNNDWVAISKNDSKLITNKIQIEENKTPSVINMGLRDAVYLLEKSGMKVSFSGKGKIKNQSVEAGTAITAGTAIYLELEL